MRGGTEVEGLPLLGQLVFSRAGRDRGRPMVVVGIADERHVLVCDGDTHAIGRPKRKNVRHLSAVSAVLDEVAHGGRLEDAALRAWIAQAVPPKEVSE